VSEPAVLLVDDNLALVDNLREVLEDEGIHTEAAATGEEALGMLEKRPYNLVITDMRMPGMDGLEVLRRIHQRWPGLPVIIMTAYARDSVLKEAQSAGALGVLPKPLDMEYMIELIGRMVGENAPVLLVEDDPNLRINLCEALLELGGVVPHAAPDAASARRLAATVPFRAAIVDVRLPDGDGVELGKELQAVYGERALPVIYITGYGPELQDTLRSLLEMPGVRVLEKPFESDNLLSLVRERLA